tara:strand:+ start:2624 stop:2794 length:171 start_codon:yes stop_codon:yes gene_type:complete
MYYEIDIKDLEDLDRQAILEIVADYLADTHGDIASFSISINGEYEVSSLPFKGTKH